MDKMIRVLIVDDSSFKREALRAILNSSDDIQVIGMAKDGKEGVEKAQQLKPDVITMDISMPVMSGLEATEKIMQENPTPIIIVSSMDAREMMKALDVGAMDFIGETEDIDELAVSIIEKVTVASKVRPMKRMKMFKLEVSVPETSKDLKVVAIGISTGGPQALAVLLSIIPKEIPFSFLIVQHISDGFIGGLARWLQANSELKIEVAESGKKIEKGHVYLAPDHFHMLVDSEEKIFLKEEKDSQTRHVPSANELMLSVAQVYGRQAVGVIMTGMGADGVEGIKAIKKAGGITIAQDEHSSVIFGMNKVAIETGYVDKVLSLKEICEELIKILRREK